MKKIWLFSFALILVGLFGMAMGNFAEGQTAKMTNLQFAQFMVNQVSITLPNGVDQLPADQYYSAITNALAEKGINYFLNTKPGDLITCADLADVLYALVGGKEQLDAKGKFDYLVSNGYMTSCPADLNGEVSEQFLNELFSNPKLSGLIAETYTRPLGPAANDTNPGANAPGIAHENKPSSPI